MIGRTTILLEMSPLFFLAVGWLTPLIREEPFFCTAQCLVNDGRVGQFVAERRPWRGRKMLFEQR